MEDPLWSCLLSGPGGKDKVRRRGSMKSGRPICAACVPRIARHTAFWCRISFWAVTSLALLYTYSAASPSANELSYYIGYIGSESGARELVAFVYIYFFNDQSKYLHVNLIQSPMKSGTFNADFIFFFFI